MNRAPKAVWVFSLAFFPLGLGGIILSSSGLLQGYRSLNWPTVNGTVLSSHLEHRWIGPPQPEIRYEYTVDDQKFVSTQIWPGDTIAAIPLFTASAGQLIVEQFPEGKSIRVAAKPKNPGESVLIPGPKRAAVWLGIFSFFLILGLWSPLRHFAKF